MKSCPGGARSSPLEDCHLPRRAGARRVPARRRCRWRVLDGGRDEAEPAGTADAVSPLEAANRVVVATTLLRMQREGIRRFQGLCLVGAIVHRWMCRNGYGDAPLCGVAGVHWAGRWVPAGRVSETGPGSVRWAGKPGPHLFGRPRGWVVGVKSGGRAADKFLHEQAVGAEEAADAHVPEDLLDSSPATDRVRPTVTENFVRHCRGVGRTLRGSPPSSGRGMRRSVSNSNVHRLLNGDPRTPWSPNPTMSAHAHLPWL